MLLKLHNDFYGFIPVEFISGELRPDNSVVEYYYVVKGEEENPTERYIFAASTNKDVLADELSLLTGKKGTWYETDRRLLTDDEVNVLASRIPENAARLSDILADGPMRWDEALPLFHEILSVRINLMPDTFFNSSLHPADIFILREERDGKPALSHPVLPAFIPVRKWNSNTDPATLFFTAPELLSKETASGNDIVLSWLFSAAMLLAKMIQSDYPFKMPEVTADMTLEQFSDAYIAALKSDIHLDVIGTLRPLLAANLSTEPRVRSRSVKQFHDKILSIIRDKGMRHPAKFHLENDAEPADDKTEPMPGPGVSHAEYKKDDTTETRGRSNEPQLKISFKRGSGNGFNDVAGMDDIKTKMTLNFISIVKNPELARTFRIEPPNGLLLWGPPGNGKSFISQKLAEESGLLYTMVNPGDLSSIFIHGTQGLIADLFTKCERMAEREKQGVLLVLEEFDTLVPNRTTGSGDGNSRNDEVAEFLTRLNNCASKGVYVIATTNRIDAIDPAVMRKGRMDEVIYIDLPDEEVRHKLFQLELRDRPHDELDLNRLVKMTDGFSSGDISYLVKESARKAFEKSVATPDKAIVNITQETLEATISKAHPSVTSAERHKYEKLRDTYDKNRREQPRIGF